MGLLYKVLRVVTRGVIRGYYKKIYINGENNIPTDAPVLLAVNHPSSFTEPCVLATHLKRELHFLIRGDVTNKHNEWFFRKTNQLPIYRFRDGFSNMRQNEKQFSYCFDLLAKKGCITIFCEGSTKHIKRTRPVQKGTARIAFGAMENRKLDEIWIVPIGVNFESSPRPRSVITVQVGKPISAKKYYGDYLENDRKALNSLTAEIEDGLRKQMVNIRQDERLKTGDDILLYLSNDMKMNSIPIAVREDYEYFHQMNRAANELSELDQAAFREIQSLNSEYKNKMGNISDKAFVPVSKSVFHFFFMTLGSILACIGGLFLWLPQKLTFTLQDKLNKREEFMSGFRMAGFLIFVPLFMIIWMIIFAIWWGKWVLLFLLLLPALSYFAVIWYDHWKVLMNRYKFKKLNKSSQEELISLREEIIKTFKY
ncbi:1-acyl-sn-glycerol-3-phosphate acyltransferase [Membranihabitans maritimus]|uniref:1-acyl-sn-glycerol-3-phosphate acyltransferase n=1 Tax=Membranihabitans maritimus TaxID=2904244 RepID=UPI001F0020AD